MDPCFCHTGTPAKLHIGAAADASAREVSAMLPAPTQRPHLVDEQSAMAMVFDVGETIWVSVLLAMAAALYPSAICNRVTQSSGTPPTMTGILMAMGHSPVTTLQNRRQL